MKMQTLQQSSRKDDDNRPYLTMTSFNIKVHYSDNLLA